MPEPHNVPSDPGGIHLRFDSGGSNTDRVREFIKSQPELSAIADATGDPAVGADVPGVGHVKACPKCGSEQRALRWGWKQPVDPAVSLLPCRDSWHDAALPATAPGTPYQPGHVSENLKRYVDGLLDGAALLSGAEGALAPDIAERDRQIISLMFASRRLVDSLTLHRGGLGSFMRPYRFCACCEAQGFAGGEELHHKPFCVAADVLEAIDRLAETVRTSNRNQGKGEPESEGERAEGRNLPRVPEELTAALNGNVCQKCGERGGLFVAETKPGRPEPGTLADNQFADHAREGFTLYTHLCGSEHATPATIREPRFCEPFTLAADDDGFLVYDDVSRLVARVYQRSNAERIIAAVNTLIGIHQVALDQQASAIVEELKSRQGCAR